MLIRAIRLVGIAAQAESRRLKVHAGTYINRLAYYVAAGAFGVAAFAMLHVLAFQSFLNFANPVVAALIILAIDLFAVGFLVFVATRGDLTIAEAEARAVRDTALSAAAEEVLFGIARRSAPAAAAGGIALALFRRRR